MIVVHRNLQAAKPIGVLYAKLDGITVGIA
jgi:hypothetical protein